MADLDYIVEALRPLAVPVDMEQFTEFREDGWPLCPNCGDDELYCPHGTDFFMENNRVITIDEAVELGLACYRCQSVFGNIPAYPEGRKE